MLLAQALRADRSCQPIVNQTALQRLAGGLATTSTYTGGYCRARQRLPLEKLPQLTRYLGEWVDKQPPEKGCWQGRRVRLVDGTTVTMPDTEANPAVFPPQRGQRPGLGFPIWSHRRHDLPGKW